MDTAVMSVSKPFTIAPTQIPSSARHLHLHLRSFTLAPIKSSSSESNNGTSNDSGGNASPPAPDAVGIRFRRGSRRRRSRQQQKEQDGGAANGLPKKEWESMTITEKAVELYVGEKGLLFWLNKFAYASIFIIIGAWILFRFVGPALNLYQLDSTPLPPTSMFKGS